MDRIISVKILDFYCWDCSQKPSLVTVVDPENIRKLFKRLNLIVQTCKKYLRKLISWDII